MLSTESGYRNQPRRRFSREFKREVVELLLEQAATVAEVARTYDLHPNQLCRWRTEYFRGEYGTVREQTACEPTLLPVEILDMTKALTIGSPATDVAKPAEHVPSKRLRRLKVVLAKGQIHLEDVEPETLGMLIEALR